MNGYINLKVNMHMTQNPDPQIYNSRIIHSYIQLIKKKYPDVNLETLLDFAGMNPHEVDDQGHWFTQNQIDRFYERLVTLTGRENIAREAGRFSASPFSTPVLPSS